MKWKNFSKILIGIILSIPFILIFLVNMNLKSNYNKFIDKLETTYNKEFEITKLSLGVDQDGFYYRAICKEKNGDITFLAYYYLSDSSLYDEYNDELLKENTATYLVSSDIGIEYAIVDIIPIHHVLTAEDVTRGVEYCLSNNDFQVKTSIYVFISGNEPNLNIENKIINKLLEFNPYACNLYVLYVHNYLLDGIKQDYGHSKNGGLYRLKERLESDGRISDFRYYRITEEDGVSLKEIVK